MWDFGKRYRNGLTQVWRQRKEFKTEKTEKTNNISFG